MKNIVEKLSNLKTTNEEIDKLVKFIAHVDSYNPKFYEEDQKFDVEIFRQVWAEASQLRKKERPTFKTMRSN